MKKEAGPYYLNPNSGEFHWEICRAGRVHEHVMAIGGDEESDADDRRRVLRRVARLNRRHHQQLEQRKSTMSKKPRSKKDLIATEFRRLDARLRGAEAITRFTTRIQLDQLADAERLRALAIRATKLRSPTIVVKGGRPFRAYMRALLKVESFAAGLTPFVTKTRQLRAALQRFEKRTKGAKRR